MMLAGVFVLLAAAFGATIYRERHIGQGVPGRLVIRGCHPIVYLWWLDRLLIAGAVIWVAVWLQVGR